MSNIDQIIKQSSEEEVVVEKKQERGNPDILDYLEKEKIKSGALFISKKKKKRLATRGLRRITDKVFDKLEITASTHGLRHWFVSNQVKKNSNLLEVIRWTRHSSVETLMVYYDELSLEDSFDKFSQAFRGINF